MDRPSPVGTPYTAAAGQPISKWSARIFDELRGWADQRQGQWAWWPEGYLVLTVDRIDGQEIEPLVLHTWGEELTLELRHWDTHFPDWNSPEADDPSQIAVEAVSVAESWLAGRFALAVYFAGDKWCGSRTVEPDEDRIAMMADIAWIKDFGPERVELRWADKLRLEHFIFSNGQLVSP